MVKPGRSVALFAGRGELFSDTSVREIPVAFCVVSQKPVDPASLQQAGLWTGVPAVQGGPGVSAYLFSEKTAGRQPTPLTQMYSEFQAGTGRELVTTTHPTESASAIMIVAPVSAQK